ncbi:MAG: NAD-dependent epimerase/dehydratase family protein [Isosphaeraceae bacterium]
MTICVDPRPSDWPVLVTGATGFVGGHVARHLAEAGHRVRGLARTPPAVYPDDPHIDWVIGDLRDAEVRRQALANVRGVIHSAAWVSLGPDPRKLSRAINVEATCALLDDAQRLGAQRFVMTSTLHTLAAGTVEGPADEATPWNLHCVDSPYCRSKREAEARVREASSPTFGTIVLCPGLVVGPRDPKPTSTKLLKTLARTQVALLPHGGIPIVDATVIACAHRRALTLGEPGERYAVVGSYLSYIEMARLVARVSGNPRLIVPVPAILATPLRISAALVNCLGLSTEFSPTTVSGGFLALHVSGRRADGCFGLEHPSPLESIRSALRNERVPGAPAMQLTD